MRDFLLSHTPPLLAPPLLGALRVALEKIPLMEGERQQLQQRSHWLHQQLHKMGWEVAYAQSPLISLLLKTEEEGKRLQEIFKEKKILLGSLHLIRGELKPYRLSISLTTAHTPEHLNQFLEVARQMAQPG